MNAVHAHEERAELLALLGESARDFCTRALPRSRLRALREGGGACDRAAWRAMAELGWLGAIVPAAQGGLELGARGAATLARALGSVAAPEPFVETAVAAASVLAHAADERDMLTALLDGEQLIAVALGGLDEARVFEAVRASESSAGLELDGVLEAVPLGLDADAWLVPATLAGEPVLCHLRAGTPGLALTPRALADATHNARLALRSCAARAILRGEAARRALQAARIAAELAASAYQLGLAASLFEMTVDYVGTRRQFGQAIGSFQSLQHRLVDAYLALRLAEAVVDECVAAVDGGSSPLDAQKQASRACQRSGEALLGIAREAIQLHGAIGYTEECDVGHYVNRGLVVTARYGRPEAHLARCTRIERAIAPPRETQAALDPALAEREPPGGDWNALDNETFRQIVRQWHAANYPPELRNLRHRARWAQCREWYARLYRRGFAAPGWPVEHGGMGLAPDKLLIFIEERERLGVVRTPDQGIIMVGPLLMRHGTPAQKAYYLPKALSGEHIWCQGYSEPNAGSDLASLRTTAVRDGEEFIVNGQKIWTTMAQDANQMFCLVRTDPAAKPQAGISFLLIDFTTPGITVRPIRNLAGDREFCEVFFDEVRVPCANLVGALNDGWTIAKTLLGFERFFIGSPKTCRNALTRAAELAVARGLAEDPLTVVRYTRYALDVAALEALYKAFADRIRRGEEPGADVSLLKIHASETYQRLTELILDLGGEAAAQIDGVETADGSLDALFPYYNARPTTIYGGSNEIQRNILAKLVLHLPAH
ncbi:MAG TPA: acyl-CoA dehydrogenase [Gammaproteobacteria bacterium]|nr:acyl-CoA dehydrogenase [Gammaproteobacteria bacterium]